MTRLIDLSACSGERNTQMKEAASFCAASETLNIDLVYLGTFVFMGSVI